jgi:hypothetical protein
LLRGTNLAVDLAPAHVVGVDFGTLASVPRWVRDVIVIATVA